MNSDNRWWLNSIGYIIYPESFKDSNDDGIGDLKGIESKLDYLHDLGINLIWLCPIFASPMVDNGYDVSDYYSINPRFGSMADFDSLLKKAHSLGIKIILDLAINHTSSSHPWFKKALEDQSSKERGYYYFLEGKKKNGKLLPPNNWASFFGGSAWEKAPNSENQYYLHIFDKTMPDLNWGNKELREEIYKISKFWLDKGVDGFRLDACAHLAKDPSFADSTKIDEGSVILDESSFSNREELFAYLSDYKENVLSKYSCLAIGEVGGCISPSESLKLTNYENGSLNMVFNFDTVWNNNAYDSIDLRDEEIKPNVLLLKHNFMRWFNECHNKADMPLYWCNHDHPRVVSQYGDIRYRDESSKMLLTTLLFLYGTPFIYNGEEIGMSNVDYSSFEDFCTSDSSVKDDIASYKDKGYSDEQILHYLKRTARSNARSPMQWNKEEYAGFSNVKPLSKVNDNYLANVNVQDEMENPWSILNFYQWAIAKRKDPMINDAVINGSLTLIDPNHPDVFAYMHEWRGNKYMVISSFRPYETKFTFYYDIADVIVHNYDGVLIDNHVFTLRPYESFFLKIR